MQSKSNFEKTIRQSEFRFMDKEKYSRIRKQSKRLNRQKRKMVLQLKQGF
jgi:hypothetical protein